MDIARKFHGSIIYLVSDLDSNVRQCIAYQKLGAYSLYFSKYLGLRSDQLEVGGSVYINFIIQTKQCLPFWCR